MTLLICILLIIIYAVYIGPYLVIMQQENYKNSKYFNWLKNNITTTFLIPIIQFTCVALSYLLTKTIFKLSISVVNLVTIETFVFTCSLNIYLQLRKVVGKISYTDRLKRLYIFNIIPITILLIIFCKFIRNAYADLIYFYTLMLIFSPILNIIGNYLLIPLEKSIDKHDEKKTTHKLKTLPNLIKVAIIGDENTNVFKEILNIILSQKYNVLQTNNSVYMENVRKVKSDLTSNHEVLILQIQDNEDNLNTTKNCELFAPNISIITDINFNNEENENKSVESIERDKYSLIQLLPDDGIIFFPADNDICYHIYNNVEKNKLLYGIKKKKNMYMNLDELEPKQDKIEFILKTKEEKISCIAPFIEQELLELLVGAAAIAKELGLTFNEIKEGISQINFKYLTDIKIIC